MAIIGISGWAGSGKTALANQLVKKHGFVKLSFAEELREIAKLIFPLTEVDLNSITRKEKKWKTYDWSPREFLVNLGEFVRYHDKEYFVSRALAKCKNTGLDYVFDDLRFENEYEAIKKLGGKTIRVNRYEKHNPYGKHKDIISETALDKHEFDYIVHEVWNVKLEDLHKQGDIALGQFDFKRKE